MTTLYKYPKTMHLLWSPGLQNDDRKLETEKGFVGKQVVVTEKMDGENATLYRDCYHARSLDSRHHPSRDWMKAFHGALRHRIPEDLRICGENLYAEHSIRYDNLEDYFMGFSVWDGDYCFGWTQTLKLFEELGITPVRVWWEGPWEEFVRNHQEFDARVTGNVEGYVVRLRESFMLEDFGRSVAKYVRKGHVQTDRHWMARAVVPNGLKK